MTKCPLCDGEGKLLVLGGGAADDDPSQDTIEPCIHCEGTGVLKNPNERSS